MELLETRLNPDIERKEQNSTSRSHVGGNLITSRITLVRENVVVKGRDYLLEIYRFFDEPRANLQIHGKRLSYNFPAWSFIPAVMTLIGINKQDFYKEDFEENSEFSDFCCGKKSKKYISKDEQGNIEYEVETNVASPFL